MFEFQFDNVADFLDMGGNALYVWASYGFFAIVMAWNLIQPRMERRKVMQLLKARRQREAARESNYPTGEEQSDAQRT